MRRSVPGFLDATRLRQADALELEAETTPLLLDMEDRRARALANQQMRTTIPSVEELAAPFVEDASATRVGGVSLSGSSVTGGVPPHVQSVGADSVPAALPSSSPASPPARDDWRLPAVSDLAAPFREPGDEFEPPKPVVPRADGLGPRSESGAPLPPAALPLPPEPSPAADRTNPTEILNLPQPQVDVRQGRDAVLRAFAPAFKAIETGGGPSARNLAAIVLAENGAGQAGRLAPENNNWFSISAVGRPLQAGAGVGGRFANYTSPLHSVADFVDLIKNSPRYREAWALRNAPPEQFMGALAKAGYIVPEPGFPVETWLRNTARGAETFDRVVGETRPAGPLAGTGQGVSQERRDMGNERFVPSGQQPAPGGLNVNAVAERYAGGTYTFGGGRDGSGLGVPGSKRTDCSSFVSAAFREQGVDLPAHTDAAYQRILGLGPYAGKGTGRQVSSAEARPGDVVFYMGAGTGGAITHHMGIYAGPGKVLDMSVSGGGGVKVRPIEHGGQFVILRDERLNPTQAVARAPEELPAAPPIVPTGVAEQRGGEPLPPEQQLDPTALVGEMATDLGESFASSGLRSAAEVQDQVAGTGTMALNTSGPPERDDWRSARSQVPPLEVPRDESLPPQDPVVSAPVQDDWRTRPGATPPLELLRDEALPPQDPVVSTPVRDNWSTRPGPTVSPVPAPVQQAGAATGLRDETRSLTRPAMAVEPGSAVTPNYPPEQITTHPAEISTRNSPPQQQSGLGGMLGQLGTAIQESISQAVSSALAPLTRQAPRDESPAAVAERSRMDLEGPYASNQAGVADPTGGDRYPLVEGPLRAAGELFEGALAGPITGAQRHQLGREQLIRERLGENVLSEYLDNERRLQVIPASDARFPALQARQWAILEAAGVNAASGLVDPQQQAAAARNPRREGAEAVTGVAQGVLAGGIAPAITGAGRASLARQAAATAVDPLNTPLGAAAEAGIAGAGRAFGAARSGLEAAGRAVRNAYTQPLELGPRAAGMGPTPGMMDEAGRMAGTEGAMPSEPPAFDRNGYFRTTTRLDPEYDPEVVEALGIPAAPLRRVGPDDYLYHFTNAEALPSIRSSGLRPGEGDTGRPREVFVGAERVERPTNVTFVADNAAILSTVDRDAPGVERWALLRFRRGDTRLMRDREFREVGSWATRAPIAPERIEVFDGQTWRPVREIGGSGSGGTPGGVVGLNAPPIPGAPLLRNAALGATAGASGEHIEAQIEGREVDRGSLLRGALLGAAAGGAVSRRGGQTAPGLVAVPSNVDPAIIRAERMYNAPLPKPTGAIGPVETVRRWIVRHLTDNLVDMAELQRMARKEIGRPLNADELMTELVRTGRAVQPAAKVRIDEGLRPALLAVGEDLPWLRQYMTHQGNVEVAAALNNPNRTFSGGLTAAESQRALDWMRQNLPPETLQRVGGAADQLRAFVDDYRERFVEAGVWTRELADDLKARYPTYTPVKVLDYLKDPIRAPVGPGGSLSLRNRGLRALTEEGTDKAREDPLASLIRYAYDAEAVIAKNRAFNAFVKLSEAAPETFAAMREVPSSYTTKRGEKIVTGFVDGQRKTYVASTPIAEAITMEAGAQMPGFVTAATTLFRELITRFPMFVAGQIPLDAYGYLVRETARNGGPQTLPRVAYELVRAYGETFRGLLSGEFKGDAARYLREGGGMGGVYDRAVEANKRALDDLTRRSMLEVKDRGDLLRLIRWLGTMEWSQAAGQRVELAPRVASMRMAERRGANQVESVIAGRDVTLDFQRGGTLARTLNQAVPFFNVGWQSAAATSRAIRENPAGFLASSLALVAAPALTAEAWNRSDSERARNYDDVPDYVKDRGLVYMLPGVSGTDKDGNPRPNYLLIPMRELAPIAILARQVANTALRDDERGWSAMLGAAASAASPIQANNPADLASSLNPVGVNTALQLSTNRDFFRGGDIATERADEEASPLSKGLADRLGVRPSQVEFALRDLGGGAAQAALAVGREPEDRLQAQPVIGGIVRRYVGDATGARLQRARDERVPETVGEIIREAGFRPDEIVTPVGRTAKGVPLTKAQQEMAQSLANAYIQREIAATVRSSEYRQPRADRERLLREAVQRAKNEAAERVLSRIPESVQERFRRAEAAR